MSAGPSKLPPKHEVALALLQTASSVFVHLDPRSDEVLVPHWFKKQPQLVLQIGLNMTVQIPDLDVGAEAISCTLSFNRSPEFCRIPYSAIFALVGEDGRGMVWPESIPAEVAASASGRMPAAPTEKPRRPKLRVAHSDRAEVSAAPADDAAPAHDAAPSAGGQAGAAKAGATKTGAAKAGATKTGAAKAGATKTGAAKTGPAAAQGARGLRHQAKEAATEEPSRKGRAPQKKQAKDAAPDTSPASSSTKSRKLPPYLRVVK